MPQEGGEEEEHGEETTLARVVVLGLGRGRVTVAVDVHQEQVVPDRQQHLEREKACEEPTKGGGGHAARVSVTAVNFGLRGRRLVGQRIGRGGGG